MSPLPGWSEDDDHVSWLSDTDDTEGDSADEGQHAGVGVDAAAASPPGSAGSAAFSNESPTKFESGRRRRRLSRRHITEQEWVQVGASEADLTEEYVYATTSLEQDANNIQGNAIIDGVWTTVRHNPMLKGLRRSLGLCDIDDRGREAAASVANVFFGDSGAPQPVHTVQPPQPPPASQPKGGGQGGETEPPPPMQNADPAQAGHETADSLNAAATKKKIYRVKGTAMVPTLQSTAVMQRPLWLKQYATKAEWDVAQRCHSQAMDRGAANPFGRPQAKNDVLVCESFLDWFQAKRRAEGWAGKKKDLFNGSDRQEQLAAEALLHEDNPCKFIAVVSRAQPGAPTPPPTTSQPDDR